MASQVSDVFSTAVPTSGEGALVGADKKDSSDKKSLFDKASGWVADHPKIVIAVIIVLLVALIVVIAYFHGIGPLGPHSSFKASAKAYRNRNKNRGTAAASPEKPPPAADAETEKLIAEINSAV